MNAKERDETLRVLLENYDIEKNKSKVFGREESQSRLLTEGTLLGFLMAFKLEMQEFETYISIRHIDSGRLVMVYRKFQ